jgi:signal transduction histidine kinase/FixJ family two-component response regulator
MAQEQERILVVESDAGISDLIARQALQPQGYVVKVVEDASEAIQQALAFSPDVVIASLELPGLSGKDLMVALNSQNMDIPVIMIAAQGQEKDVIQSFRLGASDYVGAPVRETEVVSAVERALKQVRARRERQSLSRQLEQSNAQLQKRVNELTTIFGIGKAVTSITDQDDLFAAIVQGAVKITTSDLGWLLTRDEKTGQFILRAHQKLPKSLEANLNKPWDDGLSNLVAMSGETLSIQGEALERFKVAALGKSAMVAPVRVRRETIALLVVMRKENREFSEGDEAMLEAVSDYASISLVNARLFQALDERAARLQEAVEQSQENEKVKDEIIQNVSHELRTPLVSAKGYVDMLVSGEMGRLAGEQRDSLELTQHKLDQLVSIVNAMSMMRQAVSPQELTSFSINEFIEKALGRFVAYSKQKDVQLVADLPREKILVRADRSQTAMVLDALLSNAIKFSREGGKVLVALERTPESLAHVAIKDEGIGISKKNLDKVFDRFYQVDGSTTRRHDGLGIGLSLVREIVNSHGGEVWVESKLEAGSTFHFTLLPPDLDSNAV